MRQTGTELLRLHLREIKFEFRMVGSRDSIASANIVLNTIVAEAFSEECDVMEQADDVQKAIHDLIKEYAIENQKIILTRRIFTGMG